MKHFPLCLLAGIFTFFVGVSIVVFWYFHPQFQSLTDEPILSHTRIISDKGKSSAWQAFLSFENQDIQNLEQIRIECMAD